MTNKMKKLMGILLSFVMVLGLMPGIGMTAYAGNATQVIFGSVELETGVKYTVVGTGSNQRIEKSNSNPETGFIQWNSDTSTLELNNVSYSGTDASGKAIQSNGDLTIHLSGVNSVTENGFVNQWGFPYSYGIYNKDSLTTIEAEINGSLTVTGGSSSQGSDRRYSYGICGGGIRVKSGNIVAKGGDLSQNYSCSYGISDLNSSKELSIDGGGVLTCIGGETTGNPSHSYGISGFEIDLKDGTLISTGGENVFEYTSYTVQSGCKAYVSSSKDGTETSECGAGQSINSGSKYKYIKIKSLHKSTITAVPTASDITYGQKLENSVLTGGTANVDGTFTWKDKTTAPVVADSQSAEYDVVFTPTDNDNYKTAECKVKLTVNPKEVGLKWTDTELTYNGQEQTPTATATGLVSGDEGKVNVSVTGGQTNAKTEAYTATASGLTGDKADNYKLPDEKTKPFTISPKSITGAVVTLDSTQLTYNGSEQSVSVTDVSLNGVSLTTDDYTVSGNTGTNKNNYTVTVTGKGNYKDVATADWKIVAKAMTVTAEPVSKTYDGNEYGIIVNVTEPSSETTTVKYGTEAGTYNLDASPKFKDAGTYTVYYKVSGNNDYSDYEGSATVTISKKAVTANVSAEDKPYDGKTDVTVTASVPTEALVSGDSIEIAGIKGSFDDANVGAGKKVTVDSSAKSISGSGSDNYEVTIPAETTASISKSEPKVTAPGVATLTYNGSAQELVTAGKAEGGEMQYAIGKDATTAPVDGYRASIPTATDAGTYYVWYKAVGDENHNDSAPACVTAVIKGQIFATVTFKVINGSWNDGEGEAATADRTVTLTGKEGDVLKLTAEQIPAVGDKPGEGYKAGAWDVTPSTEIEITQDTTYTYTYVGKDAISATVTFKVVNGSWNNGEETTADRKVTLTGKEGDVLKLTADQIPAVGDKPATGYTAGAWNVTPDTETVIKEDTTFIYTYAVKQTCSAIVTFKVVNGIWDNGEIADKTVTLTGYEGDPLKLTADQIPAVGKNPAAGYKAGSWDTTPGTDIEIKKDTTFTYSFAAEGAYTVTVTNDGNGTGTATPSSGATGTEVKLTAAPETGYSFKEWQVVSGGVTITNNSFKIGNANVEIKAIFTKDPVNYNTVSVTGSEHIISGEKNAVITVKGIPDDSRTYSSFTGADMDGQPIPTGNYTAEKGSLILTLKASYLDTLSVGKHKLTINFTDGSADTTITVLAKPVPKTGDNSNPVLWLAMMILGMAVLAGTAVKVYRKRQ